MLLLKVLNCVQDLFLDVPAASHPWLFWDFVKLHGNQDSFFLMAKAAIHSPCSEKDISLYTDITVTTGLVQQPDKIVVRFALTIYPYSLSLYRFNANCIASLTCCNLSVDRVVISDSIFPFETV